MLDQLIPEEVGEIELFQLAEGQGFAVEQPEGIEAVLQSTVHQHRGELRRLVLASGFGFFQNYGCEPSIGITGTMFR